MDIGIAGATDQDCFKEEFKRYKKRSAATDLSDVVDLRDPERFRDELTPLSPVGEEKGATLRAVRLGLKPLHEWRLYGLASVPGLIVIPDPFRAGCQHRWVRQCLVSYPCKPNICNLDAHMERAGRGEIWPGELVASTGSEASATKKLKLSKDDQLYRLRWVTLGYHYDWNTKEYYNHVKSPFPEDLTELSQFIVEMAGFPRFVPEAAIVNYYHLDSTLSGHTDHSEKDLSIPLLSLSFGQSAVFLIGGRTRQVRPKALLLHSGDIIIMSGDSRLAYHGVPRVLPPATGTIVPDCLSTETLQQCVRGLPCYVESGDGKCVCCVCSTEWNARVKHGDLEAGNLREKHIQQEEEASILHLEKASGCNGDNSHLGGTTSLPENSYRVTSNETCTVYSHNPTSTANEEEVPQQSEVDHHQQSSCCRGQSAMNSDSSLVTHGSTNCCQSCQGLVDSWSHFVTYLSQSRINVNVRQVVSEKHSFGGNSQ